MSLKQHKIVFTIVELKTQFDNEINPEIFIKEVEKFFKSSNAQCLSFNRCQEDFKVYGKEIFRFEYLLIKHPENPNEIANLRFCVMSYPMIAKVLNLPEHDPYECEYDYHKIQLELEHVSDNGLSGFDKCVQYFISNVPLLKPVLSSGEQEIFDLQRLLSKLDNNDMSKLFQEKTKKSKICSLTLLPINQGDTFYLIPIQYELKQYGNNPYVYPTYLNFYDPFMRLFYDDDDRFSLDSFLTKMIKCQLSDNGLVKISNDNIISQNPMLNIIKYHDYPYFMPSNNDGYQIRCGISNGVVYDCLLISEYAIKLLINEFKEVSQFDAIKNNEKIDYELLLQFPILKHIQSSKVAYNVIYKRLHQHLSIFDWFEKDSQNNSNEMDIKNIVDCFNQQEQEHVDVTYNCFKIGILLHTLFIIADSKMFTYLDMCGSINNENKCNKINPNLEHFWLDLYGH